ncbi:ferredoxin [Streptomyces sp. NRRL F-5123]|uniref:ferredoxin n=1 Tax=Streptomyces sp. NRRL F-5123 TaxID=1463856 RepID=UPI00099C8EA6|nr:ferredoxin [Streptomyces sp. NRRL F-5123]
MRITVDRELCCGSGNCVANAPEVFDQDDAEGLVELLVEEAPESLRAPVERAAHMCPVGAISVSPQAAPTN